MRTLVDDWVGVADFAFLAGVKPATIRTYAHRGIIPPAAYRVSGSPVWRRVDAEEWIKHRRRPGRPKRH